MMRCPFCGQKKTQVKDSRPAEQNSMIRRRRLCGNCGLRFTTHERVHIRRLNVVKRNGSRVPFDPRKISDSLSIALRKRDVSTEQVEQVLARIVQSLENSGEIEIPSSAIGRMVMEALKQLDQVAYVRFASVYRNFRETVEFERLVEDLRAGGDH